MHIRILETGEPPAPLDARFGTYPAMFERMLSPLAPDFSFSTTSIHHGESAPAIDSFDGLIITGSPAGVYEDHNWIESAEDLVRNTAAAGKPQVGVCFGHQLMAQAFGGKVEKSDKGWGVGVHNYKIALSKDWMRPAQPHMRCAVSHQDQVTSLPTGALALGGSDFCPYGMLEYAQGPAISFQPHPEFSHEYGAALLRSRQGVIPEAVVSSGLETYNGHSDRDRLAHWIVNFFKFHGQRI